MVGTKVPNGVPRPVVNSTNWQPLEANAVAATKSFPGALSRFSPLVLICSPYINTSFTSDFPHFCVQPNDFSSSVEIPPALFPGEGFSYIGWLFLEKYSLKSLINSTVRSNIFLFTQRFIRMVSAPNISGTSVNTEIPPCAMRKSEKTPNKGLAVIPESPSEPPHFKPTFSSESGISTRTSFDTTS